MRSYGQKGYHIIFDTLLRMVKKMLDKCHALVHELDVDAFIERVLIPEVAARLIQDDRRCDFEAAVQVLQASHEHGKLAFPVDDYDQDVDSASQTLPGLMSSPSFSVDLGRLYALVDLAPCTICTSNPRQTVPSTPSRPKPRPVRKPGTAANAPSPRPSPKVKIEPTEAPLGFHADGGIPGFVRKTIGKQTVYELLSDDD